MNAMRSSSKKLSMHAISQFPKLNPLTIRADTYLGETACMEAVKAKRRAYKLWTRHKTDHYKEKVQVGKDQEKAQSEKDSHSKNRGGKNQTNNQVLIP